MLAISAVGTLFGHPAFAAALGVLLGVSLTLISRSTSRLVTPRDPFRGMVKYGAFMLARMTFAIAMLALYFVVAPDGLAPFGASLGLSFVGGLLVEAVRATFPHTSHTSA